MGALEATASLERVLLVEAEEAHMRMAAPFGTLAFVSALLLSACGSDHDPMDGMTMGGPSGVATMGGRPGLMSVSPGAGAIVSSDGASIVLRFSLPMATGMEQWVDLHRGDLAGDTLPLSCAWSSDRSTLTCVPVAPLTPGMYALHVGGGMLAANGGSLDWGAHHPGGQWAMPGPGTNHAGHAWGEMGQGWHAQNGSYGMVFTFSVS